MRPLILVPHCHRSQWHGQILFLIKFEHAATASALGNEISQYLQQAVIAKVFQLPIEQSYHSGYHW